jgi:hypothetical protein
MEPRDWVHQDQSRVQTLLRRADVRTARWKDVRGDPEGDQMSSPVEEYDIESVFGCAALWYAERLGFRIVPLGKRSKSPEGGAFEWQNRTLTDPGDIREKWEENPELNVGVLLGFKSGWITDIDLDCPEAVSLAPEFLDDTAKFGRAGARDSHWVYWAIDSRYEEFNDPITTERDKKRLLEIRSGPAGHQTVFPPSVHQGTGAVVQWKGSWPEKDTITTIDSRALRRKAATLASATLLLRYWPGLGVRRSTVLALVGGLCRSSGWTAQEIYDFSFAVASRGGDGKAGKLTLNDVVMTSNKISQNQDVSGWPALAKYVGDKVVDSVRDWLGFREEERRAKEKLCPYSIKNGQMYMRVVKDDEEKWIHIASFSCEISNEVTIDDGITQEKHFEITGEVEGRKVQPFTVPAAKFSGMKWIPENFGSRAVIDVGKNRTEHVRNAIQILSSPGTKTILKHTGWRQVGDEWVYLSNSEVESQYSNVSVDLPRSLGNFSIPRRPKKEDIPDLIDKTLDLFDMAPVDIMAPLFGAVWRSVLGPARFSIHIEGASGSGKTELAALCQQFFGARMDSSRIPASWVSTGNALEVIASMVKDAILVIDDFAPSGGQNETRRLHSEAERILRAQGNLAGRDRLNPDSSLKESRHPRGLIISTGEDIPGGVSLRARQVIISLRRSDIDWAAMTKCQAHGTNSVFVNLMSAFISWLRPSAHILESKTAERERSVRDLITSPDHMRIAANVAGIMVGLNAFLRFCETVGYYTREHADNMADHWFSIVKGLCRNQADEVMDADPVHRFITLVRGCLSSGRAHITTDKGLEPDEGWLWGWQMQGMNSRPMGPRIGYIDGDWVYLEPSSAIGAVNDLGAKTDGRMSITSRTLSKRLKAAGLSQEGTVQKRVCGKKSSLVKIHKCVIYENEEDEQQTVMFAEGQGQ